MESSTDNGKTPTDANILQMNWDNNGGYDAQLAISTSANRMEFRDQISTKKAWREVVTSTPGTAAGDQYVPAYISTTGVATAITTNSVSDSIPYDATATNRIKTIRVYTKWVEGTGESMNNDDDTNASSDSSSSYKHNIMNVTMKFTQTI